MYIVLQVAHVWFLDSSRQPSPGHARHRHSHAGVGFVDWLAWMLTHMRVLAVCAYVHMQSLCKGGDQ